MCGIAGAVNLSHERIPDLEQYLQVMNALQRHRGPDGEGLWQHSNRHVGFAHCRLAIIDLTTGNQPMRDKAGNWVTYNGEIYNYIELRSEIGQEQFVTTSDTEVILHAYHKWGVDCVNHFRGMFAFALWDEANQTLFCARDRFGIKP
jgi:asparagine synthase (glutamine-hydrolysing)